MQAGIFACCLTRASALRALNSKRLISWWIWSAVVATVASSWQIVRADPDGAASPPLPPSIQQANPSPTAEDNWRPRTRPPTTAAPAAPAGDRWRPRGSGDPGVVPATHQQPAGPKDGAVPGPRPRDEPAAEDIPTMPALVGGQPKANDQTKEERAILLSAARNAVKQGNLELAVSRYEEYLRRYGDDAAVQKEYAGVLFSANRLGQAVEQYQRLLEGQPDNATLRVTLGDIFLANQEFRKAVAEFLRVLKQDPTNLEAAARLARAYALDEDLPHAQAVFDEHLAGLRPGDSAAPHGLGALLIDLDRPAEAARFLRAALEQRPDDLESLADLVRAQLALGERDAALATLEELNRIAPRAIPVRQTLADTLYQNGEFEIAGSLYEQILAIDPANVFARVGTARVAVQLFDPIKASHILDGITPAAPSPHALPHEGGKGEVRRPTGPVQRIYWLTRAEYHQLVGEYIEAKEIYGNFLDKNPADHEVRLALARLQAYVHGYEKAKAEFSKIPPDSALGRKARLGFAAALFDQRFFGQAADACQSLLAENLANGDAADLLARSLAKMRQCDKAEALCRDFLQANAARDGPCLAVRFALGKILLDAGQFGEAAREYSTLLERPAARVPAAFYGLARAQAKLGAASKARQTLAAITGPGSGEFRARLLLADLFAGDFELPPAVEMCEAVLRRDHGNLAALIRLADAQQCLARLDGKRDEAVRTAETILKLSPTNVRGFLALARSLASTGAYCEATAAYDRLIGLDGSFTVPQRELARVYFSDHQFNASAAVYQQMQRPCADEVFRLDLFSLAQREPRAREPLGQLLHAELPADVLRDESAKLAAGAPDPDVRAGLQRILADYEARSREQLGALIEGEAKSKKDLRNYSAIPVYQSLLDVEPANEEARFDLGQVYGTLKQNHNEIPVYDQLLAINPLHREGRVALERSSLEIDPRLGLNASSFADRGHDGLTNIWRQRYQTWATLPWIDENQFVQLGFARVRYTPHDDAGLDGNILSAGVSAKCGERLLLYGLLNFEDFQSRLKDRFTFDAGARYDCGDFVTSWTRAFLENVVENGESLRQDIHRVGWDLGSDVRPTRYWNFGGIGRVAYYSDVNTMGELYLYNGVLLALPPCQLKFVLDADLQAFRHSTVFPTPDHEVLRGTLYPYYSPHAFAYYEARIEWTQWLSRDYFVHSNQCYFSLQYANGLDSNFVNYNSVRALANYDVRPWLSIGADAQGAISDAYSFVAVDLYMIVRLPCECLRR
jgi:tetratricopeptide (TPR) repeat protein